MNDILERMNVIIEVFKTNIDNQNDASEIIDVLNKLLSAIRVTIDLEDCDRVLRVEAKDFTADEVINVLNLCGFDCQLMI